MSREVCGSNNERERLKYENEILTQNSSRRGFCRRNQPVHGRPAGSQGTGIDYTRCHPADEAQPFSQHSRCPRDDVRELQR
jgi:hypothetical protein